MRRLFWHGQITAAFLSRLIRAALRLRRIFVKPGAAGHRWAPNLVCCWLPLAAEGTFFGGCEFIRYDDITWSEKSSIVCKHYARSFLSSPNKSRAASLTMSTMSCYAGNAITHPGRHRQPRCFPAWIWTNWSKSPKKSTTSTVDDISIVLRSYCKGATQHLLHSLS